MSSKDITVWRCIANGLDNEYALIPSSNVRSAKMRYKKFLNLCMSADCSSTMNISYNLLDNVLKFNMWKRHVKR